MARILIIEDNESNIYLISFILKKHGYSVIEAKSGEEGIILASSALPDLIIMDIQLPGIDGLETTRRIRQSSADGRIPPIPPIPIVALTSYALMGDRDKAIEAGCTGYIEKPINPETFVMEIESYLHQGLP